MNTLLYKSRIALIIMIFLTPLLFGFATVTKEQAVNSELEGRKLITIDSVLDKELSNNLSKEFETALIDQFILRNRFIEAGSFLDLITGKRIINGIYVIGDSDYLTELPKEYSETIINQNVTVINEFNNYLDENEIPFLYVGIPRKSEILKNEIPNYLKSNKSGFGSFFDKISSDIKYLDLSEGVNGTRLEKENYFITDHHMNMAGAHHSYIRIIEYINKHIFSVGEPKRNDDDFNVVTYPNVFIGSEGRRATKSAVNVSDAIELYYPKENLDMDMKLYNNKKEEEIFQLNHVSTEGENYNNDYAVYMGGDRNVVIENKESLTNKKVVIIGDSYDNSMISLFASHFKKTYHFDGRRFRAGLRGVVSEINPDLVIMIYDSSRVSEKNSFIHLKK